MGREVETLAVEKDAPLGDIDHSADGIDRCGFAGAIGPDNADDLPVWNDQGDIIEGHDPSVSNR
jgi:hypothetical protein